MSHTEKRPASEPAGDVTPIVRKTVTTLSDGRELIYFDDSEPYLSLSLIHI